MTLVINWSPSWDQNASNNGCSQELGRPSVIPCDLHIHLIKCKVIGCSWPCCPINHDWVMRWRLQCGPERISRGVNVKQATLWLNRGISSSEKKKKLHLLGATATAGGRWAVFIWPHSPGFSPFLTAFQKVEHEIKINSKLTSNVVATIGSLEMLLRGSTGHKRTEWSVD